MNCFNSTINSADKLRKGNRCTPYDVAHLYKAMQDQGVLIKDVYLAPGMTVLMIINILAPPRVADGALAIVQDISKSWLTLHILDSETVIRLPQICKIIMLAPLPVMAHPRSHLTNPHSIDVTLTAHHAADAMGIPVQDYVALASIFLHRLAVQQVATITTETWTMTDCSIKKITSTSCPSCRTEDAQSSLLNGDSIRTVFSGETGDGQATSSFALAWNEHVRNRPDDGKTSMPKQACQLMICYGIAKLGATCYADQTERTTTTAALFDKCRLAFCDVISAHFTWLHIVGFVHLWQILCLEQASVLRDQLIPNRLFCCLFVRSMAPWPLGPTMAGVMLSWMPTTHRRWKSTLCRGMGCGRSTGYSWNPSPWLMEPRHQMEARVGQWCAIPGLAVRLMGWLHPS
ncbi:hypothetical protein VOLCADRAFT_92166 [Volvox carteri f. nagariensis]|uniref:Uncharacterized protein n=1 Tax=Volvox carteri f. nagariensis TaxID=3068 RepID=D8TYS7_VOLCA|nr:uncharacterized protein VOLCADRAFT_92166 [Volvox carteri f. nagariensis]EFJ47364.1 hypothetical protein VOLCADRAFT_92166 [Volvox carteri f. nagariensis]|eukprot:XP_002951553.1 hypothetical protein VOLCADRAFT_92166 [Volvox carteri f. nagariensis]